MSIARYVIAKDGESFSMAPQKDMSPERFFVQVS